MEQPYEYYLERVKERDGYQCTEPGCTYNPLPKMLAVVRLERTKPDSMRNLRTVCKWHKPEWEAYK